MSLQISASMSQDSRDSHDFIIKWFSPYCGMHMITQESGGRTRVGWPRSGELLRHKKHLDVCESPAPRGKCVS